MGRKSKYTIEQKVEAVQDYKSDKRGKSQIGYNLKLYKSGNDLYRWVSLYEWQGESIDSTIRNTTRNVWNESFYNMRDHKEDIVSKHQKK